MGPLGFGFFKVLGLGLGTLSVWGIAGADLLRQCLGKFLVFSLLAAY